MPQDFAATLYLRDRESGAPASLVTVASTVANWAEFPGDPEMLIESGRWEQVGPRRALVTTEKLDLGAGEPWGWTFRLEHPDERDADVAWVVAIEAVEEPAEPETEVAVTLTREVRGRRARPLRTDTPSPPRVLADLVSEPSLRCVDDRISLLRGIGTVGVAGADDFATHILLNPGRSLPVVGIGSPPSTEPVAAVLIERLVGIAHLWWILPDAAERLAHSLPPDLAVPDGAVRIWWPGLTAESDPLDHHLWTSRTEDDVAELVTLVWQAAGARFRPVERIRRLRAELRRRTLGDLLRRLDVMESADAPSGDEGGDVTAEFADVRAMVAALARERDEALVLAAEEETERKALQSQLSEQQRAYRRLEHENETLRANHRGPRARRQITEAEFLAAFRTAANRRPQGERAQRPLHREIRTHPEFLKALGEMEGLSSDGVIKTCVQIATLAPGEHLPGLRTHQLTKGKAGKRLIRRSDKATAWRSYLETGAGGRRVHWWRLPGGGVEFAYVCLHDLDHCPE